MDKLTLTIETGNAAFHDPDPNFELSRIFREIADKLDRGYNPEDICIMDYNGNCVGKIETK